MTKLDKVLSVMFAVCMTFFIVTGCSVMDDTTSPIDNAEPVTLMDNQSYVTYSHSDSNGHWFIDTSFSDDATLYVDDEMMQGLAESEKYIATYVDASKWELVALESVIE